MNESVQIQYELESRWTRPEGIAGVEFRFSDLVHIESGENAGQAAEVIALLSLQPEPIYGVTLRPDEKFVVLPQRRLRATGSNLGKTLELRKLHSPR